MAEETPLPSTTAALEENLSGVCGYDSLNGIASWATIVGVTNGATAVTGAGQAVPSPRPAMNPAARQSFD